MNNIPSTKFQKKNKIPMRDIVIYKKEGREGLHVINRYSSVYKEINSDLKEIERNAENLLNTVNHLSPKKKIVIMLGNCKITLRGAKP